MKLLIATGNLHKLEEIADLLDGAASIELVSLRDFPQVEMPDETGETMAQNARLKAESCARQTGLAALADDSGIEVDALNGAPGVRSARWLEGTDAERTQGLLQRLDGVPTEQRTARYRCAICLAVPNEKGELWFEEAEAVCEGRIGYEPRGANGFGYDPIFEITAQSGADEQWIGQTVASALPEVKAGMSHRSRALALIKPAVGRLVS